VARGPAGANAKARGQDPGRWAALRRMRREQMQNRVEADATRADAES
jgi:hypothetical protein